MSSQMNRPRPLSPRGLMTPVLKLNVVRRDDRERERGVDRPVEEGKSYRDLRRERLNGVSELYVTLVDVSVTTECVAPRPSAEKSVISLCAPRWMFVVGTFSYAPDMGASSESSIFSPTFAIYDFLTAYCQFICGGGGGGGGEVPPQSQLMSKFGGEMMFRCTPTMESTPMLVPFQVLGHSNEM